MKSIPVILIGNTKWGYCMTPEKYPSISQARKVGRAMVEEGWWWAYRIIKVKRND